MFDFSSLNRPSGASRPTNPVEIFRSAPALAESPNDLWQGQSKALEQWNLARDKKDVLISLHTGAGKSLVGLLIAQSLVNEGTTRVLYLCGTNDLVTQTSREVTNKLGFPHSTRMGGSFSNELYTTGQGFCLTNYQALFNSRSVFKRDNRPEAIIFDDAHVAEKIIRDCYTLKISADDHAQLFSRLVELVRPHFAAIGRADYYNNVISGGSVHRVVLVPPPAMLALGREQNLLGILREHGLYEGETAYALQHLADHLHVCPMFISRSSIEIAPAFLPSKRIDYLTDPAVRRVYLSATLTSEVDFCRAFGKRPSLKIEPESDAGMGERMIILTEASKLTEAGAGNVKPARVAAYLAGSNKLLITTSSYAAAEKYREIASPPPQRQFTEALDAFRKSTSPGAFVLVGRVDGIDLPHATCRVMLADGLPTGFSLYESYLFDFLEMRNSFAAKLANRITQMFGRTNRGRNDYSAIFAVDAQLVSWLMTPRNLAHLPDLLRRQLLLGKSMVQQFSIQDITTFPALVNQMVSRDPNWLAYYTDSVRGLDVTEEQRLQAADNDQLLTEAALAEADFGAFIWDGNSQAARVALGEVVDKVVVADRRLAGWYNIQIGMTYELEGDTEAAAKQYSEAKSRTNHTLALPIPQSTQSAAHDQKPRNLLHSKLLEIFINDVRIQNDHFAKYERRISPLFDHSRSASEHEEALRTLGELVGFQATRPEQESDTNSTLDVLWLSSSASKCILIELKSKKRQDSVVNAADVGQAYNHLQWVSQSHGESQILGLIIVGGLPKKSPEAAPSEVMWASDTSRFKALFDDTMQMLRSLQRMAPLDRYAEMTAVCARAEWQPDAIFERLRGIRLQDT
ncbi:MAG: DEAD/DEAH box helicase [Mesorhizobium sp.]|uniref:DEAD/DEAH box helicase family protein n=1 Tax=Mesorhizobium sp. TaxID=1871066 RepID=UPI00121B27F2|nr:DEAD/DEAH box helicase family protein [Mesorhizobium sp.]TIM96819.1 MAG: DEAD/DEAH box helicase [Mesorhizobium sp.]